MFALIIFQKEETWSISVFMRTYVFFFSYLWYVIDSYHTHNCNCIASDETEY